MQISARGKLTGHLNALVEFQTVLVDYAKNAHAYVVDSSVVDQIEEEVGQIRQDFAGLVPTFSKATFFAHDVGRGAYYKVPAITSFVALAIGKMQGALAEQADGPTIQTRAFAYVSDAAIQRILRRDYEETQRACAAGCWKSTIILAGGAIEALLMEALIKDAAGAVAAPSAPKKLDITKWDLANLIDVAVELGIVGNGVNKLSHSVREFHNLVHAGNELRSWLVFGPEEARIAFEVLNLVDRELTP